MPSAWIPRISLSADATRAGGGSRHPAPGSARYSPLLSAIDAARSRSGTTGMALLLVRLTGLASVNRRFGYAGGDQVLDAMVQRLHALARERDQVFMIDGRSFALLVDNPVHEGHAILAADRVARLATEPVAIGAVHARVRAHIGISRWPGFAGNAEELLQQCELALAAARRRAEPYVLYAPTLAAASAPAGHYTWFDVEEALKRDEFEVFYQPQVSLRTGQLAGAEALVRWRRPQEGYVSPEQFLPAIENSQGVRAVLWFVLNSALRQAAVWSAALPGFNVSVNLAAGNLADPELADIVGDAINVWSPPAGQLTLELTESSLIENPRASARTMGELRELGVRMSIDDFGTGYSSLAYLRDLPVDELKIDRSFVARMPASSRDRDLVASIIQLAHAVGLEVVAEGIEEQAVQAVLAGLGCELGQGFLFGRPMAAREFEQAWVGTGQGVAAG